MEEQALAMFSTMMGQPGAGKAVLLAYKVYPDGREEMIRGAHLAGLNAESFKGIVAASKSATVFNSPHMPQFNLAPPSCSPSVLKRRHRHPYQSLLMWFLPCFLKT